MENNTDNQYKCRRGGCVKPVHKTGDKHHFYCPIHMNCGLDVVEEMCQGCLNICQEDVYSRYVKYPEHDAKQKQQHKL